MCKSWVHYTYVANVCWMYACVVNVYIYICDVIVCCYECMSFEFVNVTFVCLYVCDVTVCM